MSYPLIYYSPARFRIMFPCENKMVSKVYTTVLIMFAQLMIYINLVVCNRAEVHPELAVHVYKHIL